MNIEQALNRLHWWVIPQKDINGNIFFKNIKPNRTDLEAVNFMIEWVDNQKKQSLKQNQLFAKLYIYVYHKFIQHYETTVFDNVPQSELHRILDKPLDAFFKAFTQQLNDNEAYISINEGNELKNDVWDLETVTDNLTAQLTEALNRY
jgi:hypothetical protein